MAAIPSALGWRDRLRALPVFVDDMPTFDPDAAPDDPLELLAGWLSDAIDAGVVQAHAATFITVDRAGAPSSRTLILKDLSTDGLWVATPSTSQAGRELAADSQAALQFYWPDLGRQVRVNGTARPGPAEVSLADWSARSSSARASSDPETWTAYLLRPTRIEFLAAASDRTHQRLRYERSADAAVGWHRERPGE